MKKELLEYVIRECVKEVLDEFGRFNENDTVGAPAPPAGGQGTADQPPIPQPNQSEIPNMVGKRGIWYVDPKNPKTPVKLERIPSSHPELERFLYRLASKSGGPQVRVSGYTLREVPKALANPNVSLYLYIGKQNPEDPEDTDLYLLSVKTYQEAVNASISPEVTTTYPPTDITPSSSDTTAMARAMQTGGKTTSPDIDEGTSKYSSLISSMIKESIRKIKKRK